MWYISYDGLAHDTRQDNALMRNASSICIQYSISFYKICLCQII
jgi:hypothetical protein